MSRVLKTGSNRITQTYAQHAGWAKGVDVVKAPALTDMITAHTEGTVIKAVTGQKNGSTDREGFTYGNYIMIAHNAGIVTLSAHLDTVTVTEGQKVGKGTVIGRMGNTGKSFGVHLHFEVRKYSRFTNNLHDTATFEWLDPTPYLDADLPGQGNGVIASGYENNTTPNRFKVRFNGKQYAAYTKYTSACNHANRIGGIVIDGLNGEQIYPDKEDYTKSTIPNRFKVVVNGKQISAFTKYVSAEKQARSNHGVVLDGCNNRVQIYP